MALAMHFILHVVEIVAELQLVDLAMPQSAAVVAVHLASKEFTDSLVAQAVVVQLLELLSAQVVQDN
jgi:hypothetical protein